MSQLTQNAESFRVSLRKKIYAALWRQGYRLRDGNFSIFLNSRDAMRNLHSRARNERVVEQRDFLVANAELARKCMVDGKSLDVAKIDPALYAVRPGSKWEKLFRWWNYVWWSMPYEKAYGRQMRYVVWDRHHKAAIGLIGLQSPILSCASRDAHFGVLRKDRDFWINQSMSAQRLGALPPYNQVLGGKLVAMLLMSHRIRRDFQRKYAGKKTLLERRELPANLLFVSSTGAFGKSSIYNRLKIDGDPVAEHVGETKGFGTFHISGRLYEDVVRFLEMRGQNAARGCGNGPSRKMRLLCAGMRALGYKNGHTHKVARAVYVFSMARNIREMIEGKHRRPCWLTRPVGELADLWKTRWGLPRAEKTLALRDFSRDDYVAAELRKLRRLRASPLRAR